MSEWRPIESAPKEVRRSKPVDLWLHIYASPRSMGFSDDFRVTDCWRDDGKWVHSHEGKVMELEPAYITHWMPAPEPPH